MALRSSTVNSQRIYNLDRNGLFNIAALWLTQGRKVCLATVVDSLNPIDGSNNNILIVDDAGNFAGSVLRMYAEVEALVIQQCLDSLKNKQHTYLEIEIEKKFALITNYDCKRTVVIYIQPVDLGIEPRIQ